MWRCSSVKLLPRDFTFPRSPWLPSKRFCFCESILESPRGFPVSPFPCSEPREQRPHDRGAHTGRSKSACPFDIEETGPHREFSRPTSGSRSRLDLALPSAPAASRPSPSRNSLQEPGGDLPHPSLPFPALAEPPRPVVTATSEPSERRSPPPLRGTRAGAAPREGSRLPALRMSGGRRRKGP